MPCPGGHAIPRTPFDPARHALPFPNAFPSGTPVLTLPTPLGRVRIGDAARGLCGGMVFAALDGFLWGVPPPAAPTPGVVRHLARRLLASWDFPFGVLKYYDWQRRPQAALHRLTRELEWPHVQAQLDAGVPVPLGVVKPAGLDPRRLPENHQVLAHGYDEVAGAVRLSIYDPNYPGEPNLTLELGNDPARPMWHGVEGGTVRGVFRAHYARPDAPPDWGR